MCPELEDGVAAVDVLCRADHSAIEYFEPFDQLGVCACTAAYFRKKLFNKVVIASVGESPLTGCCCCSMQGPMPGPGKKISPLGQSPWKKNCSAKTRYTFVYAVKVLILRSTVC